MIGTAIVLIITIDFAHSNVALHKPASASSIRDSGRSPDNAVDGGDECYTSQHDDWKPWLLVDLLQTYLVDNANITARDDYVSRAHDYKIELFDVNPLHCNTAVGRLCVKHDGPLGLYKTLVCDRPVQGRFLQVSKYVVHNSLDTFDVCELEVAGRTGEDDGCPPVRYFPRTRGFELSQTSPVAPVTMSLFDCATYCATNQSCVGFNYRPESGACQAIVRPTSDDTVQAVATSNYYGLDLC